MSRLIVAANGIVQAICSVFLCMITVVGCSTYSVNHNEGQSFANIRNAILKTLPRGLKITSENGREFTSYYFLPEEDFTSDPTGKPLRAYARMLVLGDIRPYTTEVSVYIEERDEEGKYHPTGQDKEIAKILADKLEKFIDESPEDHNVIDQFKVF